MMSAVIESEDRENEGERERYSEKEKKVMERWGKSETKVRKNRSASVTWNI